MAQSNSAVRKALPPEARVIIEDFFTFEAAARWIAPERCIFCSAPSSDDDSCRHCAGAYR